MPLELAVRAGTPAPHIVLALLGHQELELAPGMNPSNNKHVR